MPCCWCDTSSAKICWNRSHGSLDPGKNPVNGQPPGDEVTYPWRLRYATGRTYTTTAGGAKTGRKSSKLAEIPDGVPAPER